MSLVVRCLTCHHRARWRDVGAPEPVEVLQTGGSRRPAIPHELAAWRVWARSLRGELGPVVGRCPHCDQPLISEQPDGPSPVSWVLPTPLGEVQIETEQIQLDGEVQDLASIDERLEAAMAPRFSPRSLFDIRNLFGGVFLLILGVLASLWVMAALFLVRFIIAVGVQDNVAIPLPP